MTEKDVEKTGSEAAFKEQFKIKTPMPKDMRGPSVNLENWDWNTLCYKINKINKLIDEAPVLYGDRKRDGSWDHVSETIYSKDIDSHMCLGLGIQEIEQDSKDMLIEDLANSYGMTEEMNQLRERARKLQEKDE